jgi:hypothetical protein
MPVRGRRARGRNSLRQVRCWGRRPPAGRRLAGGPAAAVLDGVVSLRMGARPGPLEKKVIPFPSRGSERQGSSRGSPRRVATRAGESFPLLVLRHFRVRTLDLAVLTHPDLDHIDGFCEFAADVTIRRCWRYASGSELRTLPGHRGAVYSMAFSPSGQVLASGSLDGMVKLWDPTSGALHPPGGALTLRPSSPHRLPGVDIGFSRWHSGRHGNPSSKDLAPAGRRPDPLGPGGSALPSRSGAGQ